MESSAELIEHADVLLRRVPPSSDANVTVVERDGERRATSWIMQTREDEEHLSCSLVRITSPRRLLDYLRNDDKDPQDWYVCRFLASDARSLDLEVVHTPRDHDPGHCSITARDGGPYPNKKAKKLARKTRILADDEIETPTD